MNSISRTLQWNSRQRQKAFHEWEVEKDKQKVQAQKKGEGNGEENGE